MTSSVEYINAPALFRHTKRDDWGMGLVVSEGPRRRRFEFQDGHKRTIARGYYHLLERVPATTPEIRRTLQTLMNEQRERVGAPPARRRVRVDADAQVAEQVGALSDAFPTLFEDPRWLEQVRGDDAKRPLKRHRGPALAEAKVQLSQEALQRAIDAGGTAAVEALVSVLGGTDLATLKTDVKPLQAMAPAHHADVARALLGLLYEGGPLNIRLDEFRTALVRAGVKPTWSMVTVPMGLARPHELVVVRPGVLRKQAKKLGLPFTLPPQPEGRAYLEAQDLLHLLRRTLEAAGRRPKDLVDVLDFAARSLAA
ncbi:MAG: hypothetical protein KC933_19465 [Myxococcales bacterium]|nr:hypothetical protein [Myxococcales bacterium]MCB9646448.1 hypothetical protein [Deltaproteobacteria bacterium]